MAIAQQPHARREPFRCAVDSLPSDTNERIAFGDWIVSSLPPRAVVLDVGAGHGKAGFVERIAPHVGRLVGMDPDAAIQQNPFVADRHQLTLEEYAERETPGTFDCLYAIYVVEHVARPDEFFRACRRLLKPGGQLFFVTPNLHHFFGLATKIAAATGVEDWLLKRLRPTSLVASYHFPTAYRCNTVGAISAALRRSGYSGCEFRMFDNPAHTVTYFPRRLWCLPITYCRVVYRLRWKRAMGTIMVRAWAEN